MFVEDWTETEEDCLFMETYLVGKFLIQAKHSEKPILDAEMCLPNSEVSTFAIV